MGQELESAGLIGELSDAPEPEAEYLSAADRILDIHELRQRCRAMDEDHTSLLRLITLDVHRTNSEGIICAIPRASFRSVLLRMAPRLAFRCRHSRQITGRPTARNSVTSRRRPSHIRARAAADA